MKGKKEEGTGRKEREGREGRREQRKEEMMLTEPSSRTVVVPLSRSSQSLDQRGRDQAEERVQVYWEVQKNFPFKLTVRNFGKSLGITSVLFRIQGFVPCYPPGTRGRREVEVEYKVVRDEKSDSTSTSLDGRGEGFQIRQPAWRVNRVRRYRRATRGREK